jgi:hypothetical protein
VRGVYLKSVGLDILWPQAMGMAMLALAVLTISIFRFRKAMDQSQAFPWHKRSLSPSTPCHVGSSGVTAVTAPILPSCEH